MPEGGVHICPGPSWERATAADSRPTRWCFKCRRHLPHTWALMDDPPERQPSYYEMVPVIRCTRCGEDHTTHPGSYRDGPAHPPPTVYTELLENLAPFPTETKEVPE